MVVKFKSFRVKWMDIVAILTFSVLLFDIPYVKVAISRAGTLLGMDIFASAAVLIATALRRKLRIPPAAGILAAALLYVFMMTVLNGGSVKTAFKALMPAVLLCWTLFYTKDRTEINRILKIWCAGLFLLLCADLATMVLRPNGLYTSQFYTENWFLGYKTNRFDYTFPLVAMFFFLEITERGRLTYRSAVVAVMALADIARSLATGGTVMLLFYIILVLVMMKNRQHQSKLTRKLMRLMSNVYLFAIGYIAAFYLIVIMPTTPLIQHLLVDVLHKNGDFSGRVPIWIRSLHAIGEHPLFGRGWLGGEGFAAITGGYMNPHNTVMTYLIVGGVVGLGLLIWFMYYTGKAARYEQNNLIFVFYLYAFLLLGLISSALAFSAYFYVLIVMPLCYQAKQERIDVRYLMRLLTAGRKKEIKL